MKSQAGAPSVSFTLLLERLIAEVILRLNNGEVTERSLARRIGISQPQMHNVLKGKRRLQPELADQLLEQFGLDVLDLLLLDGAGPSASPAETNLSHPQRKHAGHSLARRGASRALLSRSALQLIA